MIIINNENTQEQQFMLSFENAAVGLAHLGQQGNFLVVNNKLCEITGYSREELLQKTFQEITHPDDLRDDIIRAQALFRGEISSYNMEKRYIRKDGTFVWIKLTGSAVFDENGAFNMFVAVIEDISEKKAIEAALNERQEHLNIILNSITDCYIALDKDGRVLEINEVAEREIFRKPAAELTGKVFWDLYPEAMGGIFHHEYQKVFRENVPVHFEALSSVTDKWFEVHAWPREENLEVFFRDITVRKNLEVELRKSEEKFSKLFFDNPALMVITDIKSGKFIEVNESFCSFIGYPREELIGKTTTELGIVSKEPRDEVVGEVIKNDEIGFAELELTDRKGIKHPVLYSAQRILLNGESYLITSGFDNTQAKIAEKARRESEEKFKLAASAGKIGAFARNYKTGEDYWSPEFLALFGMKPDDPLPLKDGIPLAVHPDDREQVLAEWHKHYNRTGNFEYNNEHRIILPDGSIRWLNLKGKTDFDENNQPLHTCGIVMDITERKKAEEVLRQKVEENEKLLDILPAAVFTSYDAECNFISANRMAKDFYEMDLEENASANSTSVRRFFEDGIELSPEDLPMQIAARENILVLNKLIDVLLPSGKLLHMQGSAIPLNDKNGKPRGAVAAYVDVTKRVRIEKELRESEEKFRMLANNISQFAWMMDKDGWVFWYNQRWYDYTGTAFEAMQGWGWQKVHHPDHIERVLKSKKQSIEAGKVWEELFPLRSKEGEYRWFLTRAIPIKDDQGNIIRWLGTNTDVTNQRRYEAQLEKDNKLFETLLAIAAHDLKSPVANMHGALSLMNGLSTEKKLMFLDRFQELADQLSDTITGLTDILRVRNISSSATSDINIPELCDKILSEFKSEVKQSSIKLNFQKQTIHYIQPFLYSIIKNLVSNAIKYSRNEINLSIEISTKKVGSYILLTVRDNGIGIDMKKFSEKLFKPFERLVNKKVKGTGIGLFLIKDVIEKNGGYIDVESTPGAGTTFYCYLKEYK